MAGVRREGIDLFLVTIGVVAAAAAAAAAAASPVTPSLFFLLRGLPHQTSEYVLYDW